MYCSNCGNEMSDTAKFCSKCGKPRAAGVKQTEKVVEDNSVKFQLKPEFDITYKLLKNTGHMLLVVMIILAYGFGEILLEYPTLLVITVIGMLMYVVIKMIFDVMQYEELEYNFYATRIEYKDGFLNKEEKELKYKYIREITMSQNILERFCGIGTIKIFTNASSTGYNNGRTHSNMIGRNGIYIHCVGNVQEQYKTIKQIIDNGTPDE